MVAKHEHSAWLGAGFLGSVARHPDRPALAMPEGDVTYRSLAARAAGLLATMADGAGSGPPLTALLGARSLSAYAALPAILARGHGYVPLNPKFPVDRLGYMLDRSGCDTLIVDTSGEETLVPLASAISRPLTVILADREDVDDIAVSLPGHDIRPGHVTADPDMLRRPPDVRPDDPAYLLFTSGSTGAPKGVAVSHANVAHFLDVVRQRYALTEADRFSQMFDLGFDLSVFDIFAAWEAGGCVCSPGPSDLMLPTDYIVRQRLSVWFSVPSVAVLLQRLRKLSPGAFPDLRLSLFCGEALMSDAAAAWAAAAPGARLENLYGPTEVTLACTAHAWRPEDTSPIVPIGSPFPGLTAKVVDADLNEVEPGETGELLMAGPQVAIGYWQDPEKTAAAFVTDPATGQRAYRTGDLVRRPSEPGAPIVYLGRLDHQIKLHGHRVELGEVEAVLKKATGASNVAVVGWPPEATTKQSILGFVEAPTNEMSAAMEMVRRKLPAYMIPKSVHGLEEFPLTANGKVDRKALIAGLKDGKSN